PVIFLELEIKFRQLLSRSKWLWKIFHEKPEIKNLDVMSLYIKRIRMGTSELRFCCTPRLPE
ncbi:MAG: hypothetical protein ACK56I_03925, partial [bacterium]